jgi:hypothetical protein
LLNVNGQGSSAISLIRDILSQMLRLEWFENTFESAKLMLLVNPNLPNFQQKKS